MIVQNLNPTIMPHPEFIDRVRVLMVVEGTNDIEFLRRISMMLSQACPALPDLAKMERRGELIFVPFGGGHVRAWSERLAPLMRPEFHLFDHELPPESEQRIAAAKAVNNRPGCHAAITRKRSLENYLHPAAITAAGGGRIQFDDFDCVSLVVARSLYQSAPGQPAWQLHSQRARNRMANRTKRWLNTIVAGQMTTDLLADRDPEGEIIGWLKQIAHMTSTTIHSNPKELNDNH